MIKVKIYIIFQKEHNSKIKFYILKPEYYTNASIN